MEAYLRAFVNWEQNDWARLLPMAEFAYKNASTGHTPFELNCGYHSRASFEEDTDPPSQPKPAKDLSKELRNLMTSCRENLLPAQALQNQAHDKGAKTQSYASGEKVWLNTKYIKTKRNRKLESKFFGPFWVLHPVGKQTYKLELPRSGESTMFSTCHCWSRTSQGKGGWIQAGARRRQRRGVESGGNSGQCGLCQRSRRSAIRTLLFSVLEGLPRRLISLGTLIGSLVYLRKVISTSDKDHPDKSTATSPPSTAIPMARPSAKPIKASTQQD